MSLANIDGENAHRTSDPVASEDHPAYEPIESVYTSQAQLLYQAFI